LRCLFCKQLSESSKSVEHIIPESIGSKRVVLPVGVVCDKCNNYFSRKVEGPVLSHQSMRNVRAWYQVPSKKGKLPSLQGYIAGTDVSINLRATKDGKIDIQPEKEKDRPKLEQHIENIGREQDFAYIFTVDINPPKKEMSRFLAKMALEAFAFRFLKIDSDISKLIDNPHFDLIRNFARFGSGIKEWPYSRRSIFPMDTQMRHPETGEWVQAGFGHDLFITTRRETYFVFLIYGVEFVINTGGPSLNGYEEWLTQNNYISPMIERAGAQLITKEIDGKKQHFLEGIFEVRQGLIFDKKRLPKFELE
jgi:hypothetical protein